MEQCLPYRLNKRSDQRIGQGIMSARPQISGSKSPGRFGFRVKIEKENGTIVGQALVGLVRGNQYCPVGLPVSAICPHPKGEVQANDELYGVVVVDMRIQCPAHKQKLTRPNVEVGGWMMFHNRECLLMLTNLTISSEPAKQFRDYFCTIIEPRLPQHPTALQPDTGNFAD